MPQPYLKTKILSIYKPSLGLVKNEPTSILNPRASIDCQNVRLYEGKAGKRTGTADYLLQTASGVPISFYTYVKEDGTEYQMLATTTHLYQLNSATPIASSLTNTVDDRVTMNTMYDSDASYLVIGSKNYLAKKWDGSSLTTLASDVSTWKPKVIVPYQYRLLMFNIDVGGTNKPLRMSYCAANDIDDWTGTGSASRNLIQGAGVEIMNAIPIKNYLGVYKERSVTLLSYVGGTSIFATQVMVDGIGLIGQDAIVNLGTKHIFMGNDYNIYQWEGGGELIPIGDRIKRDIKASINRTKVKRFFAVANYENTEAHFFMVAAAGTYPTIFYTYNWENDTWSKNTMASISGGGWSIDAGEERSFLGPSAGGVQWYDYSSANDDATAISAYYTTPDIVITSDEHIVQNKQFARVIIETIGTALICQYSTDSGENWSDADTQSLDESYYKMYSFYISKTARKIRFKFSSTAADAAWAIRYIGIEYKERERK